MRRLSSLLFPLLLAAAPAPAAAQLTFLGIPWGTSADSVSTRIQRAGYPFRGIDQDGDRVFRGPERSDLVVMLDSAGLVQVLLTFRNGPRLLPAQGRLLADSLRQVYGEPDRRGEEGEVAMAWNRDGGQLELYLRPGGGGMDSVLLLRHEGPGYEAESQRRDAVEQARMEHDRAHGPSDTTAIGDWQTAYSDSRVLTRVDSVRFTRLGGRTFQARMLYDWMQTERLDNGLMYNGALNEVELDCDGLRWRIHRIIPLYASRAAPPIEIPEAEREWRRPEGTDGRGLAGACAILLRQR